MEIVFFTVAIVKHQKKQMLLHGFNLIVFILLLLLVLLY